MFRLGDLFFYGPYRALHRVMAWNGELVNYYYPAAACTRTAHRFHCGDTVLCKSGAVHKIRRLDTDGVVNFYHSKDFIYLADSDILCKLCS